MNSVPENFEELLSLLLVGSRIDSLEGLLKSNGSVIESVFGSTLETSFRVTTVGLHTYALEDRRDLSPDIVDVIFEDGTMTPNVPVVNGIFQCLRDPVRASVRSTVRTRAFLRLCVLPMITQLCAAIDHACERLETVNAAWSSDAFGMLKSIVDKSVQALSECSKPSASLSTTGNVAVEAVLASPKSAAHIHVKSSLATLQSWIKDVVEACSAVHACMFSAKAESKDACAEEAVLRFCCPSMVHETLRTYNRALVVCSARQALAMPTTLPRDITPEQAMALCAASCRATRVRVKACESLQPVLANWNDANVTSQLCNKLGDSLFCRCVVVVPDLDIKPIFKVAMEISELKRSVDGFDIDFRRRMRRHFCSTLTDLDVHAYEHTQHQLQCIRDLVLRIKTLVHAFKSSVDTASCIQTSLRRTIKMSVAARVADLKADQGPTRCPHDNINFNVYDSDDVHFQSHCHGEFQFSECTGAIVCVHPKCVSLVPNPTTEWLSKHSCIACDSRNKWRVEGEKNDRIVCESCGTKVTVPSVTMDKHGWKECPDPCAGIETCIESKRCLGCGMVVVSKLYIDDEEDERTFADDDVSSARHSFKANPYLSSDADVTFIQLASGDNGSGKRLKQMHALMNRSYFPDDRMRATTKFRKDDHVRKFCDLLRDAREANELSLSTLAYEDVMEKFRSIRWHSEKISGVRLIMFALVMYGVMETRKARGPATGVCPHCEVTFRRHEMSVHMRSCDKRPSKARCVRKSSRKNTALDIDVNMGC